MFSLSAYFKKKITIFRWQLNFLSFFSLLLGIFFGAFFILGDVIPKLFASDVAETWNFSVPGDYTVSDASLIEVSGGSAHLKVRNYSTDSNTKALLHLDEGSGSSAADDSGNANTGTVTNGTFSTGNLNNGLSLNGTTASVLINDSPSVSFSQANTLEMWTKFNTSFSAGSHNQSQTLIDKGDYKLSYDNSTGKISYELASASAASWTQRAGTDLNGSWDLNGKLSVSSQVVLGTDVYVGLGNQVGDAEVWKWDGTSWTKIGGDGLNASWGDQTFEEVLSLATDGTNIYAGLGTTAGDGELWRWNGTTWAKIGGDGVNGSWSVATYEGVYSLTFLGSALYAGLGASTLDAELWRCTNCDGTPTWIKVGGDGVNSSWNTSYEVIFSSAQDGTNVYVGLGNTAGDAEVWRCANCATTPTWTKIGGDTLNSSWDSVSFEYVLSMTVMAGDLYAGIGLSANDAEVWRWNGTIWNKVGGDSLNSGWTTNYEEVRSLTNDGTNVYAGLGNTGGDNEVWRCANCATTPVWTKIGGDGINTGFTTTHTHVQSLSVVGSTLYAGITSTSASGEMWSFNGTSWTRIGGNYINKSWGFFNLQSVESMTSHNGKLYIGTGYTVAGNAMVWEWDGATWVHIGGQGINSSWLPATYENVFSLMSYGGNLYAGLGSSVGDAEVWRWNGTSWTLVGGDAVNSSWANATYEGVYSLSLYGADLVAGLGASTNDAEVWRYNGTTWSKIGGDGLNSSWNTAYESVYTLTVYEGNLYAGLGANAGDAEVWRWNGTIWSRIGGDGVNSSWSDLTFEQVDSLVLYDGFLVAGLGSSTDDAEVWRYNGTAWTKFGGDDLNSGWAAGSYERVRSLAVYNGDLFAGIGNTATDAEVWRYNGTTWSKIGGDNLNASWQSGDNVESVHSLAVYDGRLYAGVGESANLDAMVWSYGNNSVLQSVTATQDANWHHIAATYDGTTMKIFIDGVLDNSLAASVTLPDSSRSIRIGVSYGSDGAGKTNGYFSGSLDEIRFSNTARSSFITAPYAATRVTIQPASAVHTAGIQSWDALLDSETLQGGSIEFRLSDDGGSSFKYWTGAAWGTSSSTSETNPIATIASHLDTFPVTNGGFLWQAVFLGNGNQLVTLNSVSLDATSDLIDPVAPSSLTALNQSGGLSSLTTNTWYAYPSPYFSWSGASDGGSGLAGYYVYFGTDNTADPEMAGSFQVAANYIASGLSSGSTYYLRIKAKDAAQNTSSIYAAFIYKFDNAGPTNPAGISASPAVYSSTNDFTFNWSAGADSGSGIAGYQYQVGASINPLSWSATTTDTSVNLPGAAYQSGENLFYLRTIDTAGNFSSGTSQVSFYYAGSGPSAPQLLGVSPSTNTSNSFTFTWSAPASYSGSASELTYCYSVNALPTLSNCTFTAAGVTSAGPSSFATQVGINTFYVVAKNADAVGGAISYANYASVFFTANTSAPGIPVNAEVADVSVKSTSSWKIALSWEPPTNLGSGVDEYEIYHSTDDSTYTKVASTTGIAYVDTGLTQVTHYYKVRACDNVRNCGAFSTSASLYPTGRFTEASTLTSDPKVSSVTTKSALITWSTDRASDSKVQYGKSARSYFSEEPSNSEQVTEHSISLSNLSPGTKYYYKTKWTDEDGNTGVSNEDSFETEPAPTVTDPKVQTVGLTTAVIRFTVSNASKAKVLYGTTTAFGGVKEISTSTSETTYDVTIDDLLDGTKYFYRIDTLDSEDESYEGNALTFETLPRPKISTVRVQQVRGTAQTMMLVTWETNTETSSIVTYYPEGRPEESKDEVNVKLEKGAHKILVKNLQPQTPYTLLVRGRDKAGNEAVSEIQRFTTATDTRPPQVLDANVEGLIVKKGNGSNQEAEAQLVVSWNTDEAATSQVEFGEGTGSTYAQKTQEDTALVTNHTVLLSGLTPSKVYHLRIISRDKANNEGNSIDIVSITPKATASALDLVVTNLRGIFGQ